MRIRFNTGEQVITVVNAPNEVMQKLRGNYMSMIFQGYMTSLNPVFRIGEQVDEVALHNPQMTEGTGQGTNDRKCFDMVGIANKEGVYRMYPLRIIRWYGDSVSVSLWHLPQP